MNSGKPINVGASSAMVELKAELLRKKSEVGSSRVRPSATKKSELPKSSKKYIPSGANPGVEKRVEKDSKAQILEEKSLEKSKAMLIAKAEIYDNLKTTALNYDEKEHPILASSLVNFQRKALDNYKEVRERGGGIDQDEDEWTEFTDILGRTRRCLKSEVDLLSTMNDELSLSRPNESSEISPEEQARLNMHEKWKVDVEKLNEKSQVHYQDIRFDEVRTHGVSYFEFSKDSQIREEQIRELKKLSEQTEADRSKSKQVKKERKDVLKERLKKIRQKKRAKLGLPPEEDKSDSTDEDEKNIEQDPEILEEAKPEFPPPMRPWDFGKPGVYGPKPTMSFDELDAKWVQDRRRSDRKSEFAPPVAYSNFVKARQSNPAGPTSSAGGSSSQRAFQELPARPPQMPQRIADEYRPSVSVPVKEIPKQEHRKGVEIAPPPTFEYYHGDLNVTKAKMSRQDDGSLTQSIAAGLKLIREQAERHAKSTESTD